MPTVCESERVRVSEVETTGGNIQQVRDAILRRLQRQHGNPTIVRMAEGRLRQRLPLWTGEAVAAVDDRVREQLARGTWAEAVVGADLAERLIVRTLAGTRASTPFTVDANGALYATEAGDLAPEGGAQFALAGLSPLLDLAGQMFYELSDHRGGRFAFADDDTFVALNGNAAFLRVVDGAEEFTVVKQGGANPILFAPVISKPASRPAGRSASRSAPKTPRAAAKPAPRKVADLAPAPVCLTCFQELPRTGVCDNCAD